MRIFCTFGTGQPHFPGYAEFRVDNDDAIKAQLMVSNIMRDHFDGKWSRLYWSTEDLHEKDRVKRFGYEVDAYGRITSKETL